MPVRPCAGQGREIVHVCSFVLMERQTGRRVPFRERQVGLAVQTSPCTDVMSQKTVTPQALEARGMQTQPCINLTNADDPPSGVVSRKRRLKSMERGTTPAAYLHVTFFYLMGLLIVGTIHMLGALMDMPHHL